LGLFLIRSPASFNREVEAGGDGGASVMVGHLRMICRRSEGCGSVCEWTPGRLPLRRGRRVPVIDDLPEMPPGFKAEADKKSCRH
jgi:hypothetical protein